MSTPVSLQATLPRPAQLPAILAGQRAEAPGAVQEARELQQAFSQFVGETFYGTLLGAMRKTVGKPAYFHGGQAEEMFRGRLDQQIAADMAASSDKGLAQSLFENQFPQQAALLEQHDTKPLETLSELPQPR